MRLNVIKKLVDTNILYAIQPNQLQQYRRKQAKTPDKKVNVSLQVIRLYLILGLVYLLLFGGLMTATSLKGNPGLFANMVTVFALFSMSQGFLVFYNVFYESKDLQAYRPYAFSEAEIMIGKSISVLLSLLIAILPMFSYFFVLAFQSSNLLLSLPAALAAIAVLGSVLAFLILILVHFITKTAFFRRYKTVLSNVILGLITVGSMVLYFIINQMNGRSLASQQLVRPYFPPMVAFHRFILQPFAASSFVGMAGWLAAAALLFLLVRGKVLPEFYEAAMTTGASNGRRERIREIQIDGNQHFRRFVWGYHIRLLSEGSVIMQALFMSAILPYIFIFSMSMGILSRGLSAASYLTPRYLLPVIVLGMLIATFNSAGNNLTAIGISLERENFDYLKVLPFDLQRYIRLKFWYLAVIQSILPLLLLIILGILTGMHPVTFLVLLLVWGLTSLLWSIWGYQRDYRYLTTNWTNVTELLNRGNNMLRSLLFLVLMLFSFLLLAALFIFAAAMPLILIYSISGVLLVLLALWTYLTYRHYMKKVEEQIARFG